MTFLGLCHKDKEKGLEISLLKVLKDKDQDKD